MPSKSTTCDQLAAMLVAVRDTDHGSLECERAVLNLRYTDRDDLATLEAICRLLPADAVLALERAGDQPLWSDRSPCPVRDLTDLVRAAVPDDPLAIPFLQLLMAAEEWRDQLVQSNAPIEGRPADDPNWGLVQAVDAVRALPRALLRQPVDASSDPVLRAADLAIQALDLTVRACTLAPEDGQERVVYVAKTTQRATDLWRTVLTRVEAALAPLRDEAQRRCPHLGRRPTHCPTCGKSL